MYKYAGECEIGGNNFIFILMIQPVQKIGRALEYI